jgi:hypothetical protein
MMTDLGCIRSAVYGACRVMGSVDYRGMCIAVQHGGTPCEHGWMPFL